MIGSDYFRPNSEIGNLDRQKDERVDIPRTRRHRGRPQNNLYLSPVVQTRLGGKRRYVSSEC
jgi:hypothetical protein